MTIDEIKDGIGKLISSPDTAPTAANLLIESITTDYAELDSLRNERNALNERIRDLQDTNIKLFLGQTKPAQEQEHEKTVEELVNELIDKI